MMTIEERADAYVGHPFEIDEFASVSIKRQAFIDGAREQRKIDKEVVEKTKEEMIEKAIKAFDESCGWLFIYPWYQEVLDQFIETVMK